MTDEEFKNWFLNNLETMVTLGIMHYNAERAKDIRAILNIVHPEIKKISSRIDALEQQLNKKQTVKGRTLGG